MGTSGGPTQEVHVGVLEDLTLTKLAGVAWVELLKLTGRAT